MPVDDLRGDAGFRRAIDSDPDDTLALLAWADFLEERGIPQAAGLRLLAEHGKRPVYRLSPVSGDDHLMYEWFSFPDDRGSVAAKPSHCLPLEWRKDCNQRRKDWYDRRFRTVSQAFWAAATEMALPEYQGVALRWK